MSDNAVQSVRAVLLQAFNTETTKNHGAARSGSDDESPQAILQQSRMEIEQQAEAQPAHAEVGQDLGIVRRQEIRNSFDFDDQLPVHENVRTKTFGELGAFVGDRDSGLALEGDLRLLQLVAEAAFINRLQHARSRQLVHLDGQPDDPFGQFARKQHSELPPCRSVVLRALRVESLILSNGASRGANDRSGFNRTSEPIRSCAGSDGGIYPEDSLRKQRRGALVCAGEGPAGAPHPSTLARLAPLDDLSRNAGEVYVGIAPR